MHRNQIFTIAAESDDVQFMRTQLNKHSFNNVEILIAKNIENNLPGAQLKPIHAFEILYNKMASGNSNILKQMYHFF